MSFQMFRFLSICKCCNASCVSCIKQKYPAKARVKRFEFTVSGERGKRSAIAWMYSDLELSLRYVK